MNPYRFFFSYASETHRASAWENWGRTGNYLDEFYDALCRAVALETGQRIEEVGYRDERRLTVSSFWSKELVTALEQSSVLISVISPHYLASANCGREIEFFRQRFELRSKQHVALEPHRIIPVFWMDRTICCEHMSPQVERLFSDLQLRSHGMPETYPHTGAIRLYTAGDHGGRNNLVEILARAIKDLSGMTLLPKLEGAGEFKELPSFFDKVATVDAPLIAVGPKGTNVVYAVATAAEAEHSNVVDANSRSVAREQWCPFLDATGATIEMATREGLNGAGQDGSAYSNLGMPADLTTKMQEARKSNSPVLIVLDRSSLGVPAVAAPLQDYDERDFPHVGLVTAGGQDTEECLVRATMPTKFQQRRPNHLWPIPAGRGHFVQSVIEVISGLRRCLQQTGATAVDLPSGQVPGL